MIIILDMKEYRAIIIEEFATIIEEFFFCSVIIFYRLCYNFFIDLNFHY